MTEQDIVFYVMVLLISSVITWMTDIDGSFSAKNKITVSIVTTLVIVLFMMICK